MIKGIILAGGAGTRLYPSTISITKQLLPVYDKPLIYYPLSVLMLAGIRDILIISTPRDLPSIKNLLGSGRQYGLKLSYLEQPEPNGLAQALVLGRDYLNGSACMLILGDNIFYGARFTGILQRAIADVLDNGGASVFGYPVRDPSRFGVIEMDMNGKIVSLAEKPQCPKSNIAATGLYVYDANAPAYAATLKPSPRGELEITDLNKLYLSKGLLHLHNLGRGFAWFDTGTHASLLQAAQFVHTIEQNQDVKIACLEELAWRKGFADRETILESIKNYKSNEYYGYIRNLLSNEQLLGD